MSGARQIDALDVALGEVPPADAAAVAALLRADDLLRSDVDELAPVVARLALQPAETWSAPDPPALVVGAPPALPRRRRLPALVLRPAVALGCAAALVAAGLGGGLLIAGSGDAPARPEVRRVVMAPLGDGNRGWALVTERADGELRIEASGLRPDRGARHHELWLIPAEGHGVPLAIGTFRVGADGRATARYRLPDDPDGYAALDVSVEPDARDPRHSGRSVLRAPVGRS